MAKWSRVKWGPKRYRVDELPPSIFSPRYGGLGEPVMVEDPDGIALEEARAELKDAEAAYHDAMEDYAYGRTLATEWTS
jgi:hypothetical protein